MNPRHWPQFDADEIAAVHAVLESGRVNYWTGEQGKSFEEEFAKALGVPSAVALANGTLALEGAIAALGLKPNDEVVVPARTFIATASAVVARGGRPIVADVDPESGNITAASIDAALSPRTRGVIVVHVAGWPCDMDAIMALARRRNLWVIEDCAQAQGASVGKKMVGTWGDIGIFSFCQDKIMTTGGEGGMVVAKDPRLTDAVWSLKDHGKDVGERRRPPSGARFRWVHADFGTNWRMTEMQAAIGRIQLRKLPSWVEARQRNCAVLTEGLSRVDGIHVPRPAPGVQHAGYRWTALVPGDGPSRRDSVLEGMRQTKTPCLTGSCAEIYRERAFERRGWTPPTRLPGARLWGDHGIAMLVDHLRSPRQMQVAVEDLQGVLEATR